MLSIVMLASSILFGTQVPECGIFPGEELVAVYTENDLPGKKVEKAPAPRVEKQVGLLPGEEIVQVMTSAGMRDQLSYAHKSMKVEEAWKTTKGKFPSGRKVRLGIFDTGIARGHKDLRDQIKKAVSFVPNESVDDLNGHGTHVASLAAASANDFGIVGIAPDVELYIYKVLGGRNGAGLNSWITAAVREAIKDEIDVANFSLGGGGSDPAMLAALKDLRASGCVIVAAAGNDGPGENTVNFPGAYPGVVCVASHDEQSRISRFGSRGQPVVTIGYGQTPIGAIPGPGDGLYAGMAGTSMASPQVAGAACLVVSQMEHFSRTSRPDMFDQLIAKHCMDLPPPGRDTASGFGIPDVAAMVAAVKKTEPKEPVPPMPMPGEKVIWSNDEIEIVVRVKK